MKAGPVGFTSAARRRAVVLLLSEKGTVNQDRCGSSDSRAGSCWRAPSANSAGWDYDTRSLGKALVSTIMRTGLSEVVHQDSEVSDGAGLAQPQAKQAGAVPSARRGATLQVARLAFGSARVTLRVLALSEWLPPNRSGESEVR
jgi:hypothetical protein